MAKVVHVWGSGPIGEERVDILYVAGENLLLKTDKGLWVQLEISPAEGQVLLRALLRDFLQIA